VATSALYRIVILSFDRYRNYIGVSADALGLWRSINWHILPHVH